MSSQDASGSGQNPSAPRVIANTAKRLDNVTRRGTAKMKFVPTLPVRRKKEYAVFVVHNKQKEKAENLPEDLPCVPIG
jgi:uncharacterized protein with von Willebrand factor type A (vWA) domain